MTEHKTSTLKYTNARLLAVQAIYTRAVTEEKWDKITSRFLLGEIGGQLINEENGKEVYIDTAEADAKLFTRIIEAVKEHENELDDMIKSSLSDTIQFDRLELTHKCILKAAICEFYANPNLDAPIIINEYTDMARAFYDGAEVKITNAVLDKFGKVIRDL